MLFKTHIVSLLVLCWSVEAVLSRSFISNNITDVAKDSTQGEAGAGMLHCEGDAIFYRALDKEIFQWASIPAVNHDRSRVDSILIGRNNIPTCRARRYPTDSPASDQNAFAIVLPRGQQCGFTDQISGSYSNVAMITIYEPTSTGQLQRKTLNIPLICPSRSWNFQFWPTINFVGVNEEVRRADISVRSHTANYDVFGGFGRTVVHVITIAMNNDQFKMIGSRCWATPVDDRDHPQHYEFISRRGCNILGQGYVHVKQPSSRITVYEVAEFWFGSEPAYKVYFHCDLNICPQSDNTGRCTTACSNGPVSLVDQPDFHVGSSGVDVTSNIEHVDPLHNLTSRVTVSAKSRTQRLEDFGGFGETIVHIVTVELDDGFKDNYNILGSRCWATPDENRENPMNYTFIAPRGCNEMRPGFVEVTRTERRALELTVAEFYFGEVPAAKVIYFHCDINICTKLDTSGHCTPSCTPSGAASTIGGSRLLSSGPIEWHTPNVRPRVAIDRFGRPSRPQ
ncbi:hypothetical protein BV898_01135 [Hypsibius exemplaris]|uniref:ZP domain-containing protein n=1 Tax=Hypsibius exemplaris TaxID=2072580 RepID=A0A1W0XCB9_HYPEX|nr:hypothetical protein BV898_01135 [Hypsibius exemplaris]